MKKALVYSLKVWLTSVVLAPVTMVILTKLLLPRELVFDSLGNIAGSITLFICYGTFLSIPVWLISWLLTALVFQLPVSLFRKRLLLAVLGCVLVVLLFLLVFGRDDNPWNNDTLIWMLSYGLMIIASIGFYKLSPSVETPNTVQQ